MNRRDSQEGYQIICKLQNLLVHNIKRFLLTSQCFFFLSLNLYIATWFISQLSSPKLQQRIWPQKMGEKWKLCACTWTRTTITIEQSVVQLSHLMKGNFQFRPYPENSCWVKNEHNFLTFHPKPSLVVAASLSIKMASWTSLRTSEIDGLIFPWGWTHIKAFFAIFHIARMSYSSRIIGSMIRWMSPLSMCIFACGKNKQSNWHVTTG